MAFDSLTGAQIWSTTPPAGPRWTTSSPAIGPDRDVVYSYALDGYLHAYRVTDGQERLTRAREHLQRCAQEWNDGEYSEAYLEARRAVRPLGILMRETWEQAAGDLDAPVASPYAVSYFTLPQHWQFAGQLKQAASLGNALPHGDFEQAADVPAETWTAQTITLDEVDLAARRVTEGPHAGKQCLELEIKPKKNGEPYLALTLADRTGQIDAKMWDGVPETMNTFEQDDFVKVRGLINKYNGRFQLTVHKLRRMDDHEVEFSDYLPKTTKDVDALWATVGGFVDSFTDANLKALLKAFMADAETQLSAGRTAR